jgi:hypothetical protein
VLDGVILKQAAVAYERLLNRALNDGTGDRPCLIAALVAAIDRLGPTKCQWLCHPLLIEGLHTASHPVLRRWHMSVASPSVLSLIESDAHCTDLLGNALVALMLRHDPSWTGEESLATDLAGRIRFPSCDWSIVVYPRDGQPRDALIRNRVSVSLDDDRTSFSLEASREPFLVLSRDNAVRMILHNDQNLCPASMATRNGDARARLQYEVALCDGRVRYDPIYFIDFDAHAGYTGAIVQSVLEAIRGNSPSIYREFCHLMHAVRGFELPEAATGTVGSFSDPCHPRIMGINVTYSLNHEPLLSPFCFQWFGHELAHTKTYLINDIAYANGWTFVENPADSAGCIPRYERPLSIRTVFQIPYTHFYEWVLLIHFMERRFDAVPWEIYDDPVPIGDDLALEITEAFDLIHSHAQLTELGTAAMSYFWQLFKSIRSQWQATRSRWRTAPGRAPGGRSGTP